MEVERSAGRRMSVYITENEYVLGELECTLRLWLLTALFYSPYREEKQHIGDIMAAFAPYFKVCLRANESFMCKLDC